LVGKVIDKPHRILRVLSEKCCFRGSKNYPF
jgi:hypothetical protein